VSDQRTRSRVVAQHRDVKAADAGGSSSLRKGREQRGADAAALPLVDHLDRHLGGLEVLEPHVAGDPDRRAGRRGVGDQRLVMPVIDARQTGQIAGGQVRPDGEEPLVAGPLAQAAERERHRPSIGRAQLADRDLTVHR
jgi:hypothetical protein